MYIYAIKIRIYIWFIQQKNFVYTLSKIIYFQKIKLQDLKKLMLCRILVAIKYKNK